MTFVLRAAEVIGVLGLLLVGIAFGVVGLFWLLVHWIGNNA